MTNYGSDKAQPILIDGFDIRGYLTDISDERAAQLEDTTVLGDTWVNNTAVGLQSFSVEVKGFYDDGATADDTTGDGGSNAALGGPSGVSRILNYGIEGNTVGKRAVGIEGVMQSDYQRMASKGTLHKIDAKFTGSGQVDEGQILLAHAALSGASGDGTGQDNGADSADGGVGYFQVSEITLGGYDDLKLVVQDSADDSTYVDLVSATFTDVGAKRVTVTGTVNDFTRSHFEFEGTGTGQSASAFISFSRA